MHDFKEEVEKRIYELKQIIQQKETQSSKIPEESIHIFSSGDKIQYYLNTNGKRTYIKESEKELVQKLCQKDYDQKVLRLAKKELKELEKLKKIYKDGTCEEVYDHIHFARQQVVEPIWLPDEEYVKRWKAAEYYPKGFLDNAPEHYTDRGERVRSKSETLIANALERHNIPYRYEQPLYLNGYGTIHPDFTVLNVRLRKEMHWEYLGMMDDSGYAEEALRRIGMYERNGIFPGDKLILSYETMRYPINSKSIENIIIQYLK